MSERRTKVRIRLAQIAPRLGDLARNLDLHSQLIAAARADGVDLLVFPELSLTGYYLRDLVADMALPADGRELAVLAEAAGPMRVVAGFVERDSQARLYCAAAFMADAAVRHVHRKLYLPTYGMFDEGRYLTPGDAVRAFDAGGWRAGLMICEDAWHLSVPLLLSRQGVDMLIAVSCSPARGITVGRMAGQAAWEDMLATYARLTQSFVVFCNRVGWEDGVAFWGGSGVWGPGGEVLARAPILEEALVDCHIDLRDLDSARIASPLVADERDEVTWRELERIFRGRA
ncbi:MAG: carbon-nitrogen hydrolase [Armatimonadetes bacterium]|nr:carbon-nitrogen hydrolase [Armatimonadota bacterium]